MISGRQHVGLLAMSVLVGVALAAPGSSAAGPAVIALLVGVVGVAVLVDRVGTRSVALGCLALAGFFAPANGLRLSAAITVADIFLVLSIGSAVMARTASPGERPTERRPVRADVLAALLLIAGGILGSQFAEHLGPSLSAITKFGLAAVGVPLAFVALGPTRQEIRVLSWAFLAGASTNAVVGVITYSPQGRGIGLSTHSNHLAVGCLLASGFAIGLFLTGSRRSGLVAAACWGVATVGILKSGSRAGALGAVVLIVMVLALTGSARIVAWCVVVFVVVGALLAVNVIPYDEQDAIARLMGKDATVQMSDQERAQFRAEANKSIDEHPLTGSGFEEARAAHNIYLQVWGAAGVVGLLGLAVLVNASIRGLFEGASDDRWLLGAAAGTLSFLIIAVASNILWDRYLWYAFALFITGRIQRTLPPADPESSEPSPLVGAARP